MFFKVISVFLGMTIITYASDSQELLTLFKTETSLIQKELNAIKPATEEALYFLKKRKCLPSPLFEKIQTHYCNLINHSAVSLIYTKLENLKVTIPFKEGNSYRSFIDFQKHYNFYGALVTFNNEKEKMTVLFDLANNVDYTGNSFLESTLHQALKKAVPAYTARKPSKFFC